MCSSENDRVGSRGGRNATLEGQKSIFVKVTWGLRAEWPASRSLDHI